LVLLQRSRSMWKRPIAGLAQVREILELAV
jgi:hypothetical protein